MAAVGCVLLIACANLGNLMLGRTAARRKELAIRTALGAQRGRLIRQIVTETFVVALVGSGLGLLMAFWATEFFIRVGGDAIPRAEAIAIDGRVLLFTLGLAVLAALLAGLVPALQASKAAVREHLQEGGREGGSGGSRRTRSALIAAEMALAFVLLAGAGILVRTLWNMQEVDRGFKTDRVAVMTVSLPPALFAQPADVSGFYTRLLDRVRALPGVEAAATTTGVLMPVVTNSGIMSYRRTAGSPDRPADRVSRRSRLARILRHPADPGGGRTRLHRRRTTSTRRRRSSSTRPSRSSPGPDRIRSDDESSSASRRARDPGSPSSASSGTCGAAP